MFSLADDQWQPPINVPGAQRLWGIALSPDGSKMAIADAEAQKIYLLSPENPSAIQTLPVLQLYTPGGLPTNPIGVAVTDSGAVYYAAYTVGSGWSGFFKLDTGTGQTTDYKVPEPGLTTDVYLRAAYSPLNSSAYFNEDGAVFSIDTTTDKISYAQAESGCCYGDYDLALSNDQTRLAATGYSYDANLNAESYESLNVREQQNISYVYGQKLSPDGRLLFQPTTLGIDVLDAHRGTLLQRVALPVTLSPNYDALVSDGKDNVLVAITGSNGDGIAVIDLSSIPEPSPLPYPTNAAVKRVRLGASASEMRSTITVHRVGAAQPNAVYHRIPHVTTRKLLR